MRRILPATLALALLIGGALWVSHPLRHDTSNVAGDVYVAALLNLSGPAARFDAVKQQALELAAERVNARQTVGKIKLQIADAGGSPDATQTAARAVLDRGAQYVLTGTSPTALAVAALARGRTPPIVQIANAANPDFGPPRVGEFRFWPDWRQEAGLVNDLLRAQRLKSVLIIHSADPYSEALTTAFRTFASEPPQIAVRTQQYDPAATPDFRPLLLRSQSESVEALIIFGLPPGIRAFMGQLADVHWTRPLIGGVNTNLAADEYDKARLTGPMWVVKTEAMAETLTPGSEAEEFRLAFAARTGSPPPFHALYLADAIFFIKEAQRQKSPEDSPAAAAARVRSFEGPSGTVRISDDGVLSFKMSTEQIR